MVNISTAKTIRPIFPVSISRNIGIDQMSWKAKPNRYVRRLPMRSEMMPANSVVKIQMAAARDTSMSMFVSEKPCVDVTKPKNKPPVTIKPEELILDKDTAALTTV